MRMWKQAAIADIRPPAAVARSSMSTTGCSQCVPLSSPLPTQAKEKYEKALDELSLCTAPYMENMEYAFNQCQNFEERRLEFFKEALLDVKRHLNLIENQRFEGSLRVTVVGHRGRGAKSPCSLPSYSEVYRELEHTIVSSSALEDLSWFSSTHGPGMHMNWPQFEVRGNPGIPLRDKGRRRSSSVNGRLTVHECWHAAQRRWYFELYSSLL